LSNYTSPPTLGTPKQLPYDAMPLTTPSITEWFLCSVARSIVGVVVDAGAPPLSSAAADDRVGTVIGPKRSESITATGRAPMVKMSRRMPPTPVVAPWKGSMKDG